MRIYYDDSGYLFSAEGAAGEGEEVVVLEYFENMHVSSFDSAKDTCSMRGGGLAGGELEMDDWDSQLIFSDLE